jgi:hypothetical protein
MQFLKISALLLPVLAGMNVMAAPAPAPEPAALPQPWREEAAPGQETYAVPTTVPTLQPLAVRDIEKRSFGCPGNPYACSEHVRIPGHKIPRLNNFLTTDVFSAVVLAVDVLVAIAVGLGGCFTRK